METAIGRAGQVSSIRRRMLKFRTRSSPSSQGRTRVHRRLRVTVRTHFSSRCCKRMEVDKMREYTSAQTPRCQCIGSMFRRRKPREKTGCLMDWSRPCVSWACSRDAFSSHVLFSKQFNRLSPVRFSFSRSDRSTLFRVSGMSMTVVVE